MEVPRTIFTGLLVLDSPAPGFDRGKSFSQKIAVATRWTIVNLDIRLKIMDAQADQTRSLTVRLNFSISGRCSFLDAQFINMPRSEVSARSGSNSLSECIRVVFKPCFRYILLTYLIPSSMLFNFLFLIILPVANIIFGIWCSGIQWRWCEWGHSIGWHYFTYQ